MLQNPCKTLGFKKIWSTKFPLGGGKPYPASGLHPLVYLMQNDEFQGIANQRARTF